MKVGCKRMGIVFGVHLALASLYFSIYSFAECHKYDWILQEKKYVCFDHLEATKNDYKESNASPVTSPSPPNPSTIPTPINMVQLSLNVLSQSLLPLIPGSFMYTVHTVLLE